jgi:nicotinamide mononucleotide adenylyltransferase
MNEKYCLGLSWRACLRTIATFFAVGLLTACIGPRPLSEVTPTETLDTPPGVIEFTQTASPQSGFQSVQLVSSDMRDISDFGWLPDGRLYYGIGDLGDRINHGVIGKDETVWYEYDPTNGVSTQIENPYYYLNTTTYQIISQHGTVELYSVDISPTGDTVLYTRAPEGFSRTTYTPQPDGFDPSELWLLRDGEAPVRLWDDFSNSGHCGLLNPGVRWLENETLIFGSCQSFAGSTFFTVDLLSGEAHTVDFWSVEEFSSGLYQAEVAHNTLSLAVTDYDCQLWIIPASQGQREIVNAVEPSWLFIHDGCVDSPVWSSDDQWVYYWHYLPDEDQTEHPWQLERINVSTRQREVVLAADDVRRLVSSDVYEFMGEIRSIVHWQLSPDGRQILLLNYEIGVSSPTLFLITLSSELTETQPQD